MKKAKRARYLVTGAAGFIGSNVSGQLLAAGHEVVGIDNLNDAYDPRLKQWRLERLKGREGFTFRHADIADGRSLARACSGTFAGAIHLAARAGVRQSIENPQAYIDANITGTLNVLKLCEKRGIGKFVLASTSSLYGDSSKPQFSEDDATDRPISPYAASKKAAESFAHTYHHVAGIDVTVVRYFTVYGPGGRPDMSLFRFVQRISEGRPITVFGDGEQSRDFTFVDDIAAGTIAGLKPLGYEVINLGSDAPVTVNHAIATIEALVDKKAIREVQPRHPADVAATWANISKARLLLGWRPKTSFHDGVAALVRWYQENRSWAKDVKTG
ncbi:MAG: SDR family NAD(P)-dependent oxidoreductase [Chloroflexi bacterium]|nr:SDR family NAD(P)-dependent oxidoreductase [Chloroflexota bacterium]